MLAGTGFRNDTSLAHFLGKETLTEGIVDFVGTGMIEVFSFEINFRAAQIFRHFAGIIEQRRAIGIIIKQVLQFCLKIRVIFVILIGFFQMMNFVHQRFRYILTAKGAKSSCCHFISSCNAVFRTRVINVLIFSLSLTPFVSMPLLISSAYG